MLKAIPSEARRKATCELASMLIQRPSITPNDEGCQTLLSMHLKSAGFKAETFKYGDVVNLWARRGGVEPLFVFAGHTDVVPSGSLDDWIHPPFSASVEGDILHGRGAADMKGSLAAMITATQSFVSCHPNHRGSIAFLITSDEEGPAVDGTVRVVEHLSERGTPIDYCLVGEPTSQRHVGDMIKVGRRGSLSADIRVEGKQGHVAYPHLADNPVPAAARLVSLLDSIEWDRGNANFPPTTFQISNINAGTGAGNVIPGHVEILCNFRFSPESSPDGLKHRVEQACASLKLNYRIDWTLFGMPFETSTGSLLEATKQAILDITGNETECSTTGGTSDGRFIAPTGAEVVELGPLNETIHRVNEQISINDLAVLSLIYERILEYLLS